MPIAMELRKHKRGTKRVCQSCEVRFYDLSRESIVCPSCGAPYIPEVRPPLGAIVGPSPAGKSSWRSSGFKRPSSPTAEANPTVLDDTIEEREVEAERAVVATVDDEEVLERDSDGADVTGLVGHGIGESNDR